MQTKSTVNCLTGVGRGGRGPGCRRRLTADATMSRQPRAREVSDLQVIDATLKEPRDVRDEQERQMETQERLVDALERQTAVARELNTKVIELIGAHMESSRSQKIASVEASRKVNEVRSALSHFMNGTARTLRSLDSPREGGTP